MMQVTGEEGVSFETKALVRRWFSRMTDTFKNLNYSEMNSDAHNKYLGQIDALLGEAVASTASITV